MPFTRYGDRLDTICLREYGEITDDALRTLIRANKSDLLTPTPGTEYVAPPIPAYNYVSPSAEIQALRDRLDGAGA